MTLVIQRLRPTTFQVQLHAFELATFVSAARAVVEGRSGELTQEAGQQLRQVLVSYDRQMDKLRADTTA